MRVLLIAIFLGICPSGYSGFGYTLKQVSFFYGKTYYNQDFNFNSLEFQYDIQRSGCRGARPYFGIGLNYGFDQNQEILGVKGMYSPRRIGLMITRKSRIQPYIFTQGNIVWLNKELANSQNHLVTGVGLNGVYRLSTKLFIRPQFQVGYKWNDDFLPNSNGWAIEAKIGIGINTRVFKRTKTDKE